MLNWTDQQKAIKSNLNVLVGMLIGAVVIVLMYVTVSFCVRLGLPEWAVVAGVAGAIAILLIVAVKILGVVADELWVKLEA